MILSLDKEIIKEKLTVCFVVFCVNMKFVKLTQRLYIPITNYNTLYIKIL